MSLKKTRDFDIVVIGSGLSSLSFIDAYLEKNKKIDVISPNFNENKSYSETINDHQYNDKSLPPQLNDKQSKIKDYFFFNDFIVNKNVNVMGTLEFGGLSNYWGLQVDQNIQPDLKCLSKKNQKKLEKSFFEIAKKAKFLGKFNTKNLKYKNDYKVDNFFYKLLKKKKVNNFKITKPILAFSSEKLSLKKKINLNQLKENPNKINAKNYYKKFLKNKKINFHNYVVKKVFLEKKKIAIICENENKKKIFYTKKVVFGCGTLVTTKLIMDFLNIKKEVKVKEHPRLITVFLSKYKIENYLKFMPSQMQIRNDSKSKSFLVDFRPGNKSFIDTAAKIYKFLFPFKFLLNLAKNYMIFSNILLDSKYSNVFLKSENDTKTHIYSKKIKSKKSFSILKNIQKKIFEILCSEKLIYPMYKNSYSNHGSAYHYFGTIPISRQKSKMSVNDSCQLKNFKNMYIIDGSVFDFKTNKYPLGAIMANARRVAKEIKK